MVIRAKFNCTLIEQTSETSKQAHFMAVTSGSEENKSFAKFTPGGNLSMQIDKETLAYDAFEVGKSYYLDITEAPEA